MVERERAAGTVEGAREEPSSSAFDLEGTGTGEDELPPPPPVPFEPPPSAISLCLVDTVSRRRDENEGKRSEGGDGKSGE